MVLLAAARLNTEMMVGGVLHPGVLLEALLARLADVRDVVLFDVALSDAFPCQRHDEDGTHGSDSARPASGRMRGDGGTAPTARNPPAAGERLDVVLLAGVLLDALLVQPDVSRTGSWSMSGCSTS